ncbi:MAG: hypothetical protein RLZZ182_2139, partial [Pseudomonadota bacterium]
NGLVDMLAVTMIIPTLIAGAASRHETRAAPLLRFAGQSSYPLYALHMPLMSVAFGVSASMGKALSAGQGWLIIVTAFIACGWIESKIDTPIRRHISAWLQPKVASPQQNG